MMISHASIIVPFLLGAALSLFLYQRSRTARNLFQRICVIHRCCDEHHGLPGVGPDTGRPRNCRKRYLGAIAITCAAVDDVTAWCILALVIALVKATGIEISAITDRLDADFCRRDVLFSAAAIGSSD